MNDVCAHARPSFIFQDEENLYFPMKALGLIQQEVLSLFSKILDYGAKSQCGHLLALYLVLWLASLYFSMSGLSLTWCPPDLLILM